ncbi:MAG: aldose 1-epimerase family protein [Clostridia bacterium]|nr:aldose 1-epimerase family protein [Clostridia bacterium]
MENIVLQNGRLTVEISPKGAELQSVRLLGEERLYQGDSPAWGGRAPILFPICGRLKDGAYTYGGKRYEMDKHGFARRSLFEAKRVSSTEAVFTLTSSPDTEKVYPFAFRLSATYRLEGDTLAIEMQVENTDKGAISFSLGSHEGFILREDLTEYALVFPEAEDIDCHLVNIETGLLKDGYVNFGRALTNLPLHNGLFIHDTLVLDRVKSREVTLCKGEKKMLSMAFDAPALMVWTVPKAPLLCLEPWFGQPDGEDATGRWEDKAGLLTVEAGKSFRSRHSITLYE